MDFDSSHDDERAERIEKWPPERIDRELFEIERAKATCMESER